MDNETPTPQTNESREETGNADDLDHSGVFCPVCLYEIDPDTCHCGDWIKAHGYSSGHSPIPMGCVCGYNDPPVPTPNPNYEADRAAALKSLASTQPKA